MFKRFSKSLDWPFNLSGQGKLYDPFGDYDGDGIPNMNDCDPRDPKKQDSKIVMSSQKYGLIKVPVPKVINTPKYTQNISPDQPLWNYSSGNAPPNWNNVSAKDIKASGYNTLSEMKAEYKNNNNKFVAKTSPGPIDSYGNKVYTPQAMKVITTQTTPAGTSSTSQRTLMIVRTPTKTIVTEKPSGWSPTSGPKLTTKPSSTKVFIPAKQIVNKSDRAIVGKGMAVNPYLVSNKDNNIEYIYTPYGWDARNNGPALNKGYTADSTKPLINANALRDQNTITYVNKERTQALNPYYNQRSSSSTRKVIDNTYHLPERPKGPKISGKLLKPKNPNPQLEPGNYQYYPLAQKRLPLIEKKK